MVTIPGNGYAIIAELPVHWVDSAARIPAKKSPPSIYPVWLTDSLGTRAAVFTRCPICDTSLAITPSTASEQSEWNKEPPEVYMVMGCTHCSSTFLVREEIAYCLIALPPQQSRGVSKLAVVTSE